MNYRLLPFLLMPFVGEAQNPLAIPPTLSGTSIDLNLQNGTVNFYPGNATQTMGANGNILGPTLILNKNETVTINVTNNLADSTTIHWHGMHVAPENDGGPHIVIPPGTTWSPVIPVKDFAATHWYHPHLHMHTNEHVQKGIAGMIIVKDDEEAAITLPREYGVDDFPIVIQTKAFDANNQIVVNTELDTVVMVNATIDPYLDVPAQVVRLRLLNGSSQRSYYLGLSNNQNFHIIASDGGLLSAPVSSNRLFISPGERYEILVDLQGLNGQIIELKNYGSDHLGFPAGNYGSFQEGVGAGPQIINYDLNPLNGADFSILELHVVAPTSTPVSTIPATLISHIPWTEATANATKTLTFSMVNAGPSGINGPFVINSTPFDMMMINYYIPFENTEVWTLQNNTPISHPFHIHNIRFYVLDINGVAPPPHKAGRKDVILVPGGMSTVRFITKFEDFHNDTLPYMYHCHMLTHEDGGMMGQYIVSSPASLDELNAESGNVYPNPALDEITVRISGKMNYTIRDLSGREVQFGKLMEDENSIPISALSSGTYLLEWSDGSGFFREQFIKQ